MGWREELQDRERLTSRRPARPQPACPECAAQRTIQTIDRALYCPNCGLVWSLIDVVLSSLPPTESRTMIWFFERSAQMLELETRYCNETAEYVLEIREQNVAPQTERFTDGEAFRGRLVALERGLGGQLWRRTGPPVIIPDGWPDRKPPQ